MFDNNRYVTRRIYDLNDADSRIKDTDFSLDLIEHIAKSNGTNLQEIYSYKVFPAGSHFLDLHNQANKLVTIEHILKKRDPKLSYKDPNNKVIVIGKLKKIIWQDEEKKKLFVEYDARIQDADYFI